MDAADPDDSAEAGARSPHLDKSEQSQAASHAAPRPIVIHEIIREEGETELERSFRGLFWSALAAGLSMGFSFLTEAMLQAALPDAPWRSLVDSFGYTIGFLIVVLGRQQLFTENTLTAVLPVLTRRDGATLLAAARLWIIVLVANLLGTIGFTLLLMPEGVFRPPVIAALHDIAVQAVDNPVGATFLKAIFAGWLIALMVWLLPSARSARLLIVVIITYVVAIGHLSHIIAGAAEAAYAVAIGAASVGTYLWHFLLPTLCGNVIGGVTLVALLNHGSIAPDMQPDAPVRV